MNKVEVSELNQSSVESLGTAHLSKTKIQFPKPDVEEFFRTYSVTTFAVNAEETQVAIAANLSGKYNVWAIDLPNHYPYPLTTIDQTPHSLKYDPNGRFLIASFDHNGDEQTQLYLVSPLGGAMLPLRFAEGKRHFYAALSDDGNRVYYASDKDNTTFLNGYMYDLETGEERTLYVGEEGASYLYSVSSDERHFVVMRHCSNTYTPALLYTQSNPEPIKLVPARPEEQYVAEEFQFAGDFILFATNYQADRRYLACYTLSTGQFEKVLALEEADVTSILMHPNGKVAYLIASQGVEDKLYLFDIQSKTLTALEMPVSVVQEAKISNSGNLYVLGRGDVEPFNLYRLLHEQWESLTNNRVMGSSPQQLVKAQVLHFPSFDGLEVEALWFEANPEFANGYTVVWPHGGPQAAERKAFRPLFQFLCSRGYNVWAPNFRGSSGYGTEFMKLVEGDWGHGPRLDMVASIDYLLDTGRAKSGKLFLVGGSYGGYMTLLLHGRHSEYFEACVDIFGPANLFTFLNSVPEHWKPAMKQWLGDVDEDAERLKRDSPITYLSHMTKPMLVIQGANDPRVVKGESDQLVTALKANGQHVEYLVFDDEGHGFSKKQNEMEAYQRIVEFLDEHRK